jgi:hypothetical protein
MDDAPMEHLLARLDAEAAGHLREMIDASMQ